MDRVSPEKRHFIMSRVGTRNTDIEMAVRKILSDFGMRYRLHDNKLPGTPDIVFKSQKIVIFVHGCFWHGHNCRYGRKPKSKEEYWIPKIEKNKERDRAQRSALKHAGWKVLVIWKCQLKKPGEVKEKIKSFLNNTEYIFR